jgi:hypothetical protein
MQQPPVSVVVFAVVVSTAVAASSWATAPPAKPGSAPPPSQAGTAVVDIVKDAAARLQKALGRRDWAQVADEGRRAADAASLLAGLRITHGAITAGPHRGPGVYEVSKGGVVSGRRLYAVLEVDGVAPEAVGDGRQRHTLKVRGAFSVIGADGTVELLGEKDLGTHQISSLRAHPQHTVGIDVVLGDVPAGDYGADFTVLEPTTGQEATRHLRFRIP